MMDPRPCLAVARLECGNLGLLTQRLADLIKSFHECRPSCLRDGEGDGAALRRLDDATLEIDGERRVIGRLKEAQEFLNVAIRQDHREQTILERVFEEDVAKTRRDDTADTEAL
jgi:hypothetical protein